MQWKTEDNGWSPYLAGALVGLLAIISVWATTVLMGKTNYLGASTTFVRAAGLLERVEDPHSLVPLIDLAGLAELEARGALAGGMLPKARAIERALAGGVARVHLIPFAGPDALLVELFTNEGIGTMVVADRTALAAPPAGAEP